MGARFSVRLFRCSLRWLRRSSFLKHFFLRVDPHQLSRRGLNRRDVKLFNYQRRSRAYALLVPEAIEDACERNRSHFRNIRDSSSFYVTYASVVALFTSENPCRPVCLRICVGLADTTALLPASNARRR